LLSLSSGYRSCNLKCGEIFLLAIGTHVECHNPIYTYNIRVTFATNINPHIFVDHVLSSVFALLRVEAIVAFQTANKSEILESVLNFFTLTSFQYRRRFFFRHCKTVYFSGPLNKPVKNLFEMFCHFK